MSHHRTLTLIVVAALLTMLVSVRLAYDDWFWTVHLWALCVLGSMILLTVLVRKLAYRLGDMGVTLSLGANLGRIGIGVCAFALVNKIRPEQFPVFCASTMIGYMYYLIAEIYELVLESRRV